MAANNKPVPVISPAGVVQQFLSLIPAGASVTVSLPVGERSVNLSVGVSQAVRRPEPQQQRVIDMEQADYSALWFQQPAVE